MAQRRYTHLEDRNVVTVAGDDRQAFLQGLISADATRAAPDRALYSAFLTPQGKFLFEFVVTTLGDTLVLETEAARRDDFKRRLSMYKLRSKVAVDAPAGWTVAVAFGAGAAEALGLPPERGAAVALAGGGVAAVDPRLAAAGVRLVAPPGIDLGALLQAAGFAATTADDYDRLRLALGLPDGSRDMPVEKAILLENGFDELGGVDWKKGCYLGQELTARTKYRGLVRKRLLPVAITGPTPAWGAPLTLGDTEAGEMRSAQDGVGLALIRLEALQQAEQSGQPFQAGATTLVARRPDWAVF